MAGIHMAEGRRVRASWGLLFLLVLSLGTLSFGLDNEPYELILNECHEFLAPRPSFFKAKEFRGQRIYHRLLSERFPDALPILRYPEKNRRIDFIDNGSVDVENLGRLYAGDQGYLDELGVYLTSNHHEDPTFHSAAAGLKASTSKSMNDDVGHRRHSNFAPVVGFHSGF
ncbi:hypothetical protein BX600DRAFT_464808 [Xylariales sp. PMI_506]|nr:hypothetical protein BX600DRAFT_464808 [Xylariales sp. PMI_506]